VAYQTVTSTGRGREGGRGEMKKSNPNPRGQVNPHPHRMTFATGITVVYRENSFNVIQIYTNPFNAIRFYSFPSMPSNLNSNPLNAIAVSFKLTPLVIFKANPSNAIKNYTDPFNATRNWFDLFGFKIFKIENFLNLKVLKRKYTTLILKFISICYH
jgi:hypothetical protein